MGSVLPRRHTRSGGIHADPVSPSLPGGGDGRRPPGHHGPGGGCDGQAAADDGEWETLLEVAEQVAVGTSADPALRSAANRVRMAAEAERLARVAAEGPAILADWERLQRLRDRIGLLPGELVDDPARARELYVGITGDDAGGDELVALMDRFDDVDAGLAGALADFNTERGRAWVKVLTPCLPRG